MSSYRQYRFRGGCARIERFQEPALLSMHRGFRIRQYCTTLRSQMSNRQQDEEIEYRNSRIRHLERRKGL